MQGLVWKTATIAIDGTVSTAADLGRPFKSLAIVIPAIVSGTVAIHTAMTASGTYQALSVISTNDADDDPVLCSTSTGAINVTVPFFGWQHLKIVTGAGQTTTARTIYVAGFD